MKYYTGCLEMHHAVQLCGLYRAVPVRLNQPITCVNDEWHKETTAMDIGERGAIDLARHCKLNAMPDISQVHDTLVSLFLYHSVLNVSNWSHLTDPVHGFNRTKQRTEPNHFD